MSYDGKTRPSTVLSTAVERGLRGVAITDHDTLTVVSNPYKDLILLTGMEIRIQTHDVWGDIIALGVTEDVPLGLGARETVEAIHDRGGLAIVPHPFSDWEGYPALGEAVFDIGDIIDGIEVSNPRPFLDNKRARKVANQFNVARVGGSDAHRAQDIGRSVTTCPPVENADEFMEHVLKRRTEGIRYRE
jgi:predicted metal-dependent phosphoesterase TrpH